VPESEFMPAGPARKRALKKAAVKKAAAKKITTKKPPAKKQVRKKKRQPVSEASQENLAYGRQLKRAATQTQRDLDGSGVWTEEQKDNFLRFLEKTCNATEAARLVGKKAVAAAALRQKDPRFAADWTETENAMLDMLEAKVIQRAIKGVKRGRYYKGEKIGADRFFSDQLALFLLRARRPAIYGPQTADDAPEESAADIARMLEEKIEALRRVPVTQDATRIDADNEG
jgi:hypothetical protein